MDYLTLNNVVNPTKLNTVEDVANELRDTQSHFINDVILLRNEICDSNNKSSEIVKQCIGLIDISKNEVNENGRRIKLAVSISIASLTISSVSLVLAIIHILSLIS